ncbi:MAG TPA: glycosyltransferase family 87 protein [Sphingomicrobium sp.]|nr:glycosyltransferase family 87 protein [Sphingomicrobium sp.]
MPAKSDRAASAAGAAPSYETLRRVTVVVLIFGMLMVSFAPVVVHVIHRSLVPDFTMLWMGGCFGLHSPSLLYDVDAMTAAQQGLRASRKSGLLPFIYPPTTLLFVAPFALVPFWPAYILWTIIGVAAFWTAARRLTSGWVATLSLLSPPAVAVWLLGQTTFIVGAAILWSLALMRERPILAGALMAVGAAIKPQSAILGPVAFIADRNWKALIAAACIWLLLACASLAFGPGLWLDWFDDLAAFPDILAQWNLYQFGATPSMLARFLELSSVPFLVAGVVAGIAVAWIGMESDDLKTRAMAFVGGTLLASPYAMSYEVTMMAPMLIAAALTATFAGLVIALPLIAARMYAIAIVPSLLVSVALKLWMSRRAKAH